MGIIKTDAQVILPLQSVALGAQVISGDIDVSTRIAVQFFINFGRRNTPDAGAGIRIRIEGSSHPWGDGYWDPLMSDLVSDFTLAEAEDLSSTAAAGQKVLAVASTTNLLPQQNIFIRNPVNENCEWARIKSLVVNTSVTIEDNLLNVQPFPGSRIFNKAEMWAPALDVSAVKRLRIVVDGSLYTQPFAIRARMVTTDAIG
jgi:hypothetical protein